MKKAPGSGEGGASHRQPLAQENLGTSGLGGESHEELLLSLPISPFGRAPGQETRSDRRGPFDTGDFLSHDENRIGLHRPGRRLL
jgi:hypothetical protein